MSHLKQLVINGFEELKYLFTKVFKKLMNGRQLVLVKEEEIVCSREDFEEFVKGFYDDRVVRLKNDIDELKKSIEKKEIRSYQRGLKEGISRFENKTILLPCTIQEEKKYLTNTIGQIAKELLEQGDQESCEWILRKLKGCRSL